MNDLNKAIELSGGKGKVAENVCVKRPRNTKTLYVVCFAEFPASLLFCGFFFDGLLGLGMHLMRGCLHCDVKMRPVPLLLPNAITPVFQFENVSVLIPTHVTTQAFMQRGALHRLARKDDEARADFQAAAAMGNIMAKSELVTLNPYAAMCNQMMTEVLAKAKSGAN
jgi:hypothetical protein